MFLKLTKQFGKPICVALYAAGAAMASKKKPLPLLALFGMHAAEYALIGKKTAAEYGLGARRVWPTACPSASPGGCLFEKRNKQKQSIVYN